ncbi:nitrile hydratase accessory protein [Gymnodinialimonas hymeniacidonis]|uniref:nitrile hydratase accessory protein n=1 Tax=Gymnodinialimonas hymeniacidonis TaxID=3126508 RepID=UPI0034C6C701
MTKPEQPFEEPWQAQAFALTVHLHDQGHFNWNEWADALSAQIHSGAERTYYNYWLCALEALIAAKGITTPQNLASTAEAWKHAAARTPHGQPITLSDNAKIP